MESAHLGGVPALDETVEFLSGFFGKHDEPIGPVISTVVRLGDQRLSVFAIVAQFGTPVDVTLVELRVELLYPADETTRRFFEGAQ